MEGAHHPSWVVLDHLPLGEILLWLRREEKRFPIFLSVYETCGALNLKVVAASPEPKKLAGDARVPAIGVPSPVYTRDDAHCSEEWGLHSGRGGLALPEQRYVSISFSCSS